MSVQAVEWRSIDFTHAKLPSLRLSGGQIEDCIFDNAYCEDLRAWDLAVNSSSFKSTQLRNSALGTFHEGRTNRWHGCQFNRADLRGSFFHGGSIIQSDFAETRLDKVNFERVRLQDLRFEGLIDSVVFDQRPLGSDEPDPAPLERVDFSAAMFRDVEFLGCHFEQSTMPPGVLIVANYPVVVAGIIANLNEDASLEGSLTRFPGRFLCVDHAATSAAV